MVHMAGPENPSMNKMQMEREQTIQHVKGVIEAVFKAEHEILPQWEDRLRLSKDADPDTRQEIAESYLRATAEEMLSNYGDEELKNIYI